jgi:deoxyribodipyrimidine photo-lyase
MTNERAKMYVSGEIERPIETLDKAIAATKTQREAILKARGNATGDRSPGEGQRDCIVFWFKSDLRTKDNRGLSLAASQAAKLSVPLVCVYLVSPQDFSAHLTAPIRVDFILRNLAVLKRDLAELDVPLYVETVEKRRNLPGRLVGLCKDWGARGVYCNIEYEVDELRREAKLTRDFVGEGMSFIALHDTCVVKPGELKSGAGGQISIYSPWHRKWCAYLNSHLKELEEYARPSRNPGTAREMFKEVFESGIPEAPEGKRLSVEEKKRFEGMWPAGEEEAMQRLQKFIGEKIEKYHDTRNLPGGNGTSTLSPHLAAGTIAARTVVRMARDAAPRKTLTDDRKQGHSMWIGEVAWRDFYKHVLCHWPYICMNKPFKSEYSNIVWEYDMEQFKRWTEGQTGFPIVDAAMRQAKSTGYMHNRCRMIVASFLAKDLLIDWRMGEKWFMEHLIDGDFASNNGGWGFSASCGVDPQPYFRIFNPWLQSEKFDVEGGYIKRWVPELEGVKGKAIHDPYGRGSEAEAKRKGYPRPMVDHKQARERCLERYKAGIGRSTA